MQIKSLFLLSALFVSPVYTVLGEDDLAEYQKSLNQEVMSQEFFAEQPEKVDAYIKEASEKNLKPLEYNGNNWRAGYTCRNLLR